jgi:prepilin-type N-terminal cleavage/methylation domain-containing protein
MHARPQKTATGFTLIELMIVVAIIGILAAIAVPKFADLISKSQEGATKGNLATVRSALKVYYADTEGWYPGDNLACLTANSKYLKEIPTAKIPAYHAATARVCTSMYAAGGCLTGLGAPAMWDGQNNALWLYWEQDVPPMMGTLRHKGDFWIGCTHLDAKNMGWSLF